jgi:tetratricopeptide (TPR) repeat protein
MKMKRDWQHWSIGFAAVAISGTFLVVLVGLPLAKAAPANQPSSNAPANEQPPNPAAAPADTGTKQLPGPPNPFEEHPAQPPDQGTATTGRKSLAEPAPLQGPSGTPSATEPAKPETQGRMPGPNPFETQPSTPAQPEQPSTTPPPTPERPSATPTPTPAPSAEQPANPSAPSTPSTPSNPSAEQPSEETYTPAQQAVNVGRTLLQQAKYDEAVGHFDEALKIDPTEGSAYFYKGVAYRMLNRLDEAIDAFTKSIDLTTDDLDAQAENYLRRGIVWFYKGEYGIAWQDFDDATIFAKDSDPRPDFWKGLALARQNKLFAAANAYAVAIEHDDHFVPAFVNLGLTYLALDEPTKAIFCFDQGIRLDPHNAASYFKRGLAQAQADKLPEAVDSYTQAIRLNPDYAEAYFNRSVANRRLGDQQQADKDRAAAIKIKPDIEQQLTGTG